ncbi:MAG: amino acid permease [Chitinophagaceae bacterium]
MMEDSAKESLRREIGVRSLVLAILNITVGSGIFIIPALLAAGLGAAAILAYLVCGLLIFLIALCFAEIGSSTTKSGGAYSYIETAFGPYAGFLANNVFWIGGGVVSDAAIANALADTLKFFFPSLAIDGFRMLFLVLVFIALTVLNVRSVKNGVRLVEVATLTKLFPLIGLVILSAAYVEPSNLRWLIRPTVENIGAASLLLWYAFIGLEGPLSNGGEIKNPKRTVPLGLLLGVFTVLVLYIGIQLVTQGVLGEQLATNAEAPLAAVAGVVIGKWGTVLITIIMVIAMLGALSGELLSLPRILFAGARDGLMPSPLAKVHPVFQTPYIAVIVYGSLGCLLAVSGGFKQLATITSASILLLYLGVVLASVKLRRDGTSKRGQGFRMPGGITVPVVASAGIIWLLSNLSGEELTGMGIFLLVFSGIYFALKLVRKPIRQ